MSDDDSNQVREYYNQVAEGYEQDTYGDSTEGYPANRIRRDIIVERLLDRGVESVLDVGCGDGAVMLPLLENGTDVKGFDFAENMVSEARGKLDRNGFDPERVWQGDVLEELPADSEYDAVISLGVFPHLADQRLGLEGIKASLADDGIAYVQFRNDLFDIFTLNEYTYEFYWNTLLQDVELPDEARSALDERLRDAFEVDATHETNEAEEAAEIEYSDIYAPFSNPFTTKMQFHEAGFNIQNILFYHYHALLPEFEERFTETFHRASRDLEDAEDWRGHFMASAFVVEATK